MYHRLVGIPILITLLGVLAIRSSVSAGPTSAQPAAARLGAVAAVPPGCTSGTNTFTSTPNRPIPAQPSIITDTIRVSGAHPVLWDLNLTTNIPHTSSGDMDITLQSPAGTVVTLSTFNGGALDNVFAGTVWDDSADPDGQVPYETNNGLVTDHAYTNLVVATPLVPEEPLAAFAGENPNGLWLLTISDSVALGAGTLVSWSMDMTTLTSAPTAVQTVQATNATRQTISTSGTPVVVSSLTLTPTGFLSRIIVTTAISHTFSEDLDVTLTSPDGKIVTLTTDNGGGNADVFSNTVWDVDANPGGQAPYLFNQGLVTDHLYASGVPATPLTPEESLGAFWGISPAGAWVLTISDDTNQDGGSLNRWSLNVSTAMCQLSTPTSTPVATATSTPVATATSTPVATATSTPVATATSTPVATATSTPVATATSTPTPGPLPLRRYLPMVTKR